jgi:hypothetical protein
VGPELLRIVYAPASYYRPWRSAYGAATPAQQRWLNATLIRQHALPVPPAGVSANATVARRMVGLWDRLPEVATLIGAARLRDWVAPQRAGAALPLPVQAFMRAGHVPIELPERPTSTLEDDPDLLLRWGARDVRALAPMLPTWLSARLWLPLHTAEGESPQREIRPDMDLFWSAVNYVEKLS